MLRTLFNSDPNNIKFQLRCQCGLTSTYFIGEGVPSPVVCQCCGHTLTKLSWILDNYSLDALTEEQAKDLCVESWNEVAENRSTTKYDSKLIQEFDPRRGCFACSYYDQEDSGNCTTCPFKKFTHNINYISCTSFGSPFKHWTNNPIRANAIAIADLFID